VIIQNGRVARFGAHLPLSENLEEVAKRGTRHTAAIGLSELSDALVVVVSEERGTVSIARGGELQPADDAKVLISALKDFAAREGERGERRTLRRMLFANMREKLLAFGAAALLWFLVAFPAGTVQRDFVAPVSFQNLPGTVTIIETDPKEITVALAARGRTPFDGVDPLQIAVVIDGKSLQPGLNEIVIQENMVHRPANVSVANLNPNVIRVRTETVARVQVPVEVRVQGEPQEGFAVTQASSVPRTVELVVPEDTETPARILTEPVSVSGASANVTKSVPLVLPRGTRLVDVKITEVVATVSIGSAE
jgi:YbbR domain-containing protein